MIDPLNPGPAGSTGPAGVEKTAPNANMVQAAITASTATIASALQTVLTSLTTAIDSLMLTVKDAISKAAESVITPLNSAQTTIDLATARVAATAPATATATTTTQPIYTVGTAGMAFAAQNPYNIWGHIPLPHNYILAEISPIPSADINNWCWVAGFATLSEAVAALTTANQTKLPPSCSPPPPPPTGCTTWRVWELGGVTPPQCQVVCTTDPDPPSPWFPFGPISSKADADTLAATICGPPPPPPPPPTCTQWTGGCKADGTALTWCATDPVPPGIVKQTNNFDTQDAAQKAAVALCQPSGGGTGGGGNGGGTGGGTGGGGGGGGSGCCPVQLPDCIKIDLCDWSKFEESMTKAVYTALCKFVQDEDCQCKISDSDKWIWKQCKGDYDQDVQNWLGTVGGAIMSSASADDLAANAFN